MAANGCNRALASEAHRRARRERIETTKQQAEAFLGRLPDTDQANHIAAAMLYLGEGAKREGLCAFGNSNVQVIRYWLHLLRTSFASMKQNSVFKSRYDSIKTSRSY